MCSGEKDANHTVAALCSSHWKIYYHLSWCGQGWSITPLTALEWQQRDPKSQQGMAPSPWGHQRPHRGWHFLTCSWLSSEAKKKNPGLGWKLPAPGCECHQQLPGVLWPEEIFNNYLSTLSGTWWDSWDVLCRAKS